MLWKRVAERASWDGGFDLLAQFASMPQSSFGDFASRYHSGKLLNPVFFVQTRYYSCSTIKPCAFLNVKMMVSKGGHLREVGDAEHLRGFGQPSESFPDLIRNLAANPGIDFIKDERALLS